MSDFSISLVPMTTEYPNRKAKAVEILTWLITAEVVEPMMSACLLGPELGYAPANQAGRVVNSAFLLPLAIRPNGLEITTRRAAFTAELEELICPNCRSDVATDDWDLTPWFERQSQGMRCPPCKQEAEIHKYRFIPTWGFSDLGFTFWNWPTFEQSFLKEFEQRLDCSISVINQHI